MAKNETLEVTTPSEREVRVTRVFDAPRELVFDALTQPDLLRRWYGRVGWSLVVCDVDLRVGGAFRFVSRRPNGKDVGQRGVYREVVRPERIVHTETWEDWNPGECLITVVLTETESKTLLTNTTLFPSREVRDQLLEAGLRDGAADTYGRLSEFLVSEGGMRVR
jgi:uncharacterized protein YndB with AHSA1/START domain